MDYKELIEELRMVASLNGVCCDCNQCVKSADAIETLMAERDAMIFERNAAVDEMRGICKYCKHGPPSYRKTACYDCCDDNHNWQWRGPQKEGTT